MPGLLLIFIVPGYVSTAFAADTKNEFVAVVIVGYAIYAVTLVLFLIVRWFTGIRIHHALTNSPQTMAALRHLLAEDCPRLGPYLIIVIIVHQGETLRTDSMKQFDA